MSVDFPEPVRPTGNFDEYSAMLLRGRKVLTNTNSLSCLDTEADIFEYFRSILSNFAQPYRYVRRTSDSLESTSRTASPHPAHRLKASTQAELRHLWVQVPAR